MKVGYRDDLKHKKGRNKGSLHSKFAQSYMTPSQFGKAAAGKLEITMRKKATK